MNEHREESRLNTADIAGAPERQPDGPGQAPDYPEVEPTRAYPGNGSKPLQDEQPMALMRDEEAEEFRVRWNEIQVGFVDEPRLAVKEADSLVAELMKQLAELFSRERSQLEAQWGRGDDVSTEELRLALKRYRSFFNRLLSV
jgi:hypothetical protein